MGIKFKYQAAAVPPISNETTRRFGQNLVTQQRQQDFAKQQLGQQLGARDFQNATSNMSSYLQDMLDNDEITDEPTRRRILGLKGGLDTVMGSGFTDDQRRHYLNQYGQQVAGILANAPVKAPELTPQQKFDQGIVTRNGIDYVLGANGRYEPLKQPEQPKLPKQPEQPPKSFREYYDKDPQGAAKAFADKVAEIRLLMDEGEPLGPWKSPEERAFAELEAPYKEMQGRYSQPTQAPPSAGALPAPTTGVSTGGSQGNNPWAGVVLGGGREDAIARPSGPPPTLVGYDKGYAIFSNGARVDPRDDYAMKSGGTQTDSLNRLYNPDGTKKESSSEGALELAANQSSGGVPPQWRQEMRPQAAGQPFTYSPQTDVGDWRGTTAGQVSPGVDRSGTFDFSNLRGAVAENNYNAQLDAMRTPMTPEQIAVLDAQTNATMDSTNAQLAENQVRAAEIKAGYAPRTNSLKRQADAMSNKTDRAESALRSELLPRSPQGERPSSMYDISDAKDKREAEQFAANQAKYGEYKAKRDQGDAALKTRENKPIDNPETMKQDARQFSAEYQLYKRGGGTLSTRDYITQMAKQGKLSDDLKAQLEHNYKMDLSDEVLAGVEEQDVLSQKGTAKAEAKAKRDAKANRRKYPMGMPSAQQTPAPAPAAGVAPPTAPANIPIAAPDLGNPPAPKRKSQASAPLAPAAPGAVPSQQSAPPAAAPALPKAPKPNWSKLEKEAEDVNDAALIRQVRVLASQGHPEDVMNAFYVVVNPSASKEERQSADDYLLSKGIDLEKVKAMQPTSDEVLGAGQAKMAKKYGSTYDSF